MKKKRRRSIEFLPLPQARRGVRSIKRYALHTPTDDVREGGFLIATWVEGGDRQTITRWGVEAAPMNSRRDYTLEDATHITRWLREREAGYPKHRLFR